MCASDPGVHLRPYTKSKKMFWSHAKLEDGTEPLKVQPLLTSLPPPPQERMLPRHAEDARQWSRFAGAQIRELVGSELA